MAYIKEDHKYFKYEPGNIKHEADYDDRVDMQNLGAIAAGMTGPQERYIEKKQYIIEEDGVKKMIEEEIERIVESPNGVAGSSAQDVYVHGLERARAIKKWHNPVVSDREKKKIESLDKRNIFSFIGCFGGREKAFF